MADRRAGVSGVGAPKNLFGFTPFLECGGVPRSELLAGDVLPYDRLHPPVGLALTGHQVVVRLDSRSRDIDAFEPVGDALQCQEARADQCVNVTAKDCGRVVGQTVMDELYPGGAQRVREKEVLSFAGNAGSPSLRLN